jgi:methionyl-tRNA formyltransferase
MKKTSEKIVFFGSGPVAAQSLELLTVNFNIEAVITKPAKSRTNDPVPVIDLANRLGIKTYLPANRKELDELIQKNPVKTKLAILIDYGIIVSQSVIDYFPLGIVNSHFSLLPKWRGADPITFSILNGELETGVSLMLITAGMDEGPVLKQASLTISKDDTSISLTKKLIFLSNNLLVDIIPKYLNSEVQPHPQPQDIEPSYSRKLTKQDGEINWTKPASQIENEIRAYLGWPKSHTKIKDKDIIITKAHVEQFSGQPGEFSSGNNMLFFYCGQNALVIDKLKPAGKNEMDAKAFLAGYGSVIN